MSFPDQFEVTLDIGEDEAYLNAAEKAVEYECMFTHSSWNSYKILQPI